MESHFVPVSTFIAFHHALGPFLSTWSQHEKIITYPVKCGMKFLLIHSQTLNSEAVKMAEM